MTPEERELVRNLFERVAELEREQRGTELRCAVRDARAQFRSTPRRCDGVSFEPRAWLGLAGEMHPAEARPRPDVPPHASGRRSEIEVRGSR